MKGISFPSHIAVTSFMPTLARVRFVISSGSPKVSATNFRKMPMLTSTDTWFRPSDVCVAPDGSVFVADWYDPGVGGHGMGDWTRGRIYRLTPKGHTGYKVPAVKLDTKQGALQALRSPSTCVRSLVAASLNEGKLNDPEGVFSYLLAKDKIPSSQASDSLLLARLRWLSVDAVKDVMKNSRDAQAALAIFAIVAGKETLTEGGRNAIAGQIPRVYRQLFAEPDPINPLSADSIKLLLLLPSAFNRDRENAVLPPAFQREVILFLAGHSAADVKQHFYDFAKRYDGQDHFYRAALNIACGTDPERRDAILADFEKHFPEWNDKVADLVWELRPKSMLPRMEQLLNDGKLTAQQKGRIVDILAANESEDAGKTLLGLLTAAQSEEVKNRAIENLRLFLPTRWKNLTQSEEMKSAITKLLNDRDTTVTGLRLIAIANVRDQAGRVSSMLLDGEASPAIRQEALNTLARVRSRESVQALDQVMGMNGNALSTAAAAGLGKLISNPGNDEISKSALRSLQEKLNNKDDVPEPLVQAILSALAGSRSGTQWLLQQKEAGKLPETLVADAGRLLRNSPFQGERNKAMILFPAPGKLNPKKLPAISELARRTGNVENGKQIMARSLTGETQCLKCHMVRGTGGQIGPDLSMIGKKGSVENLFESILYPSRAIADQSVSWKIDTIDGLSLTGLIVQENESNLTLRDANGKDYPIPVKDIEKRTKSLVSLMPEDLIATLSEDELVDLVAYLMTLRTAAFTPTLWQVAGPFPSPGGNAGLDEELPAENADFMGWKTITPTSQGYVDLRMFHGEKATNSISVLQVEFESPVDQSATILLGTDDGARLFLNGKPVFQTNATRAAAPEQDQVKVTLVKGKNTILLKIANGDGPHGFYFTIVSEQELKGK
jgi:putative heme-binding domain-containing protein